MLSDVEEGRTQGHREQQPPTRHSSSTGLFSNDTLPPSHHSSREALQRDGDDGNDEGSSPHSEKPSDPYLVTWSHPPLPNGEYSTPPREWTRRQKWLVVSWCCFMEFGISFVSSAYSSGSTQIEEEFGVSQPVVVLGLTTFVAGLGVGSLFLAPMSEKFGRNTVYFTSFVSIRSGRKTHRKTDGSDAGIPSPPF